MKVICVNCESKTRVAADNAIIHLYTHQPWLSFADYWCDLCGDNCRLFFGPERWEEELRLLAQTEIGFISEDFAPDDVVDRFADIFDLPKFEVHDLTERQERALAFFIYLLQHTDIIQEVR